MKTRNGFVSNSSSSSFILLGCVVTREEADKLVDIEGLDVEYWDSDPKCAGVLLGAADTSCGEECTISYAVVAAAAHKANQLLSEGLERPVEVSLIMGTMAT